MFEPRFTITLSIARALMEIEANCQLVAELALNDRMRDSLRRTAQLLSTHYSTPIEVDVTPFLPWSGRRSY